MRKLHLNNYSSEQKRKIANFFYIVLDRPFPLREKFDKNFDSTLKNFSDYVEHLSEDELNDLREEIWNFQSHTLIDLVWVAVHNKEGMDKLIKDTIKGLLPNAD